jgi:adsorption protein B
VRLVVHDADGPTTKADCLNRLYLALGMDEARTGQDYASVILHDAEDMVHPAALTVIDRMLRQVDFVQLPVRPEPQASSPWIAGHYSDEFAESHAKSLVFRDAIGAGIPAAGVGCGFSRETFRKLAQLRMEQGERGPFAAECLTEDYELGLIVSHLGGQGRFVRMVDQRGALVATRSYFPADLEAAVRQKTRWIHGIALQSWDRMGWTGRLVDMWMAARDRRGPLAAVVLAAAYVLVPIELVLGVARANDLLAPLATSPIERGMMAVCLISVLWRAAFRFAFTAREYGVAEGVRAILRLPVGNVIAILAARRAILAYVRSLTGGEIVWDKTTHTIHPASALPHGRSL